MNTEKILSFEQQKNRLAFKKCEYSFSITIYIKGYSFQDAIYQYYLEYIQEDEVESALNDVIKALVSDIQKKGIFHIAEPIEPLLNRKVTIHYFLPYHGTNNGIFYYEYEPEELSDTQLIVILNNCIANLRQ